MSEKMDHGSQGALISLRGSAHVSEVKHFANMVNSLVGQFLWRRPQNKTGPANRPRSPFPLICLPEILRRKGLPQSQTEEVLEASAVGVI